MGLWISLKSDSDLCAVEPGERETIELLVEGGSLVSMLADGPSSPKA